MVEVFSVRLAAGMITSLLVLDCKAVPPRFVRVQFLAALGLLTIALCFRVPTSWFVFEENWDRTMLVYCGLACLVGAFIWHLDGAPGGYVFIHVVVLLLLAMLFISSYWVSHNENPLPLLQFTDNLASAAVLGTAISAMLLGHSYLISPTMTIFALRRMLIALFTALAFRVSLAVLGLFLWTGEHRLGNLEVETLLWLSARWLLGLLAPVVLGWMAWEAARIRSTQSATGILYVVVIVSFLGELLSLLLLQKTGSIL